VSALLVQLDISLTKTILAVLAQPTVLNVEQETIATSALKPFTSILPPLTTTELISPSARPATLDANATPPLPATTNALTAEMDSIWKMLPPPTRPVVIALPNSPLNAPRTKSSPASLDMLRLLMKKNARNVPTIVTTLEPTALGSMIKPPHHAINVLITSTQLKTMELKPARSVMDLSGTDATHLPPKMSPTQFWFNAVRKLARPKTDTMSELPTLLRDTLSQLRDPMANLPINVSKTSITAELSSPPIMVKTSVPPVTRISSGTFQPKTKNVSNAKRKKDLDVPLAKPTKPVSIAPNVEMDIMLTKTPPPVLSLPATLAAPQ
jgi:hypothetical protein